MDSYIMTAASTGLSKIYQSMTQDESIHQTEFLDPLCMLFKLGILVHKAIGTKISIKNNTIKIQDSWLLQCFERWMNSDEREQLFQLKLPMLYIAKLIMTNESQKLQPVVKLAVNGLVNLRHTYEKSKRAGSLVVVCIDEFTKLLSKTMTQSEYDNELNSYPNYAPMFTIYDEFYKRWTQSDIEQIMSIFNQVEKESLPDAKESLLIAIDQLIWAKDYKLDSLRPK